MILQRFAHLVLPAIVFFGFCPILVGQALPQKPADKQSKDKALPPAKLDPNTIEYRKVAPTISMDVWNPWNIDTTVKPEEPLGNFVPEDARLKQALAAHALAEKIINAGNARAAGKAMSDAEKAQYAKDLDKLSRNALAGGLNQDDAKFGTAIGTALKMWADLDRQAAEGNQVVNLGRDIELAAWRALQPIFSAAAGPSAAKAPIRFTLLLGPGRERSVDMRNVAGKDLHNVTLLVKTNMSTTMSGETADSYVFIRDWKKDQIKCLARYLVTKTMDNPYPVPISNGMGFSIWCDELTLENVRLDLPVQQLALNNLEPRVMALTFLTVLPKRK